MTHYQTLGINITATKEEIRAAYRRLARKYHPDFNRGDKEAGEMMTNINLAFDTLSDDDRRTDYDAGGYGHQRTSEEEERARKFAQEFHDFFVQVLTNVDGAIVDSNGLLFVLREAIKQNRAALPDRIKSAEGKVAAVEALILRLSPKPGTHGLLVDVLKGTLAHNRQGVEDLRNAGAALDSFEEEVNSWDERMMLKLGFGRGQPQQGGNISDRDDFLNLLGQMFGEPHDNGPKGH